MPDLSTTIIPKSDQTNADDLIAGPRTIRVTAVKSGDAEQPVSIHYEGDDGRPYKPCKSMRRVLVMLWGKDGTQYVGRSMTLYRDPSVRFGKEEVGGIRISHLSHIKAEAALSLTATRGKRAPYTVKPLATEKPPAPAPAKEVTDMNGPTLPIVNNKGRLAALAPDKWRDTLVTWLTTLPFDTARALYEDNADYINEAKASGYTDHVAAVQTAWTERQAATGATP